MVSREKLEVTPSFTHNLIPRFAAVHQICEEDGIFGARQPSSCHLSWALLDSDALVVLIDCLRRRRE